MSLRKQAYKGVKWTTFATILNTVIQFLKITILAHLLCPEDFGIIAMVMIVIGFANMFMDAGISSAIIHFQDISEKKLSSLYWLNIFSGIAIFLIVIFISPLAVIFFNEPRLQNLFYVAALLFLIIPIGQQFQILLQKELHLDLIAKIETLARIMGMIVAIMTAYFGVGAIAIIYGQLTNSIFRSLFLFFKGIKNFKPKFYFKIKEIKEFINFGLFEMGNKSLNYFSSRIDQLLIGKLLGATELGYYSLAFNLVVMPISRINPIITRVAFPIYAKVQDDIERLKKGYFESLKYLALINFPLLIGLAALARPFVLTIYGEKWIESITIIQIFAFIAILRSLGNPIGSLLLAKGRPDLGFKWSLFMLFIIPVAVYISVQYNIKIVAIALLVAQILIFILNYPFLLYPLIGDVKKEWFYNSFIKPFSLTMIMGIVVYLTNSLIMFNPSVVLLIGILVGILSYIFIILIFERKQVLELKKLIFS